ncbi:UNVERIFIED_CONTAM: hypothetical protein PYX00_008144 [Menopon gallinae]|uniref:Uncharacterized protein n=1 Tax=Menopon gallinae TaxID=328185 RepID=A0AAW2HM86_9NEOP
MRYILVCAFLLQFGISKGIVSNRTDDVLELFLNFDDSIGDQYPKNNPCSLRLHSSLEKLRKRQTPVTSGFIDLSGYALHQTLRHAPFDMYVTDIRVRTPGTGNWVRVEKCQFSSNENRLVAQLLFNDLAVTGNVRLFEENSVLKNPGQQVPAEFCSMTVRLKRAGLGLNAIPARGRSKGIEVRTEARFVDPNFLSVHAYGCKLDKVLGKDEDRRVPEEDARHVSHRYLETQIQQTNRLKHLLNDVKKNSPQFQEEAKPKTEESAPAGVRIITLIPNIPGKEDSLSTLQLHREDESDLNNYHKERILSAKFQNERDRLKAVLHVKNLIAQQANQVFQAHGPFSQFQISTAQRPIFEGNFHESHKPRPVSVISSITELDENLAPVRPFQHGQHGFFVNDKIVNNHDIHIQADDVSREMEDMFLRGIKTLLAKYLEKQLEIPLKEALMTSIGYTVSYG